MMIDYKEVMRKNTSPDEGKKDDVCGTGHCHLFTSSSSDNWHYWTQPVQG